VYNYLLVSTVIYKNCCIHYLNYSKSDMILDIIIIVDYFFIESHCHKTHHHHHHQAWPPNEDQRGPTTTSAGQRPKEFSLFIRLLLIIGPTQVNNGHQRPTKPNEAQRRPTKTNEGSQQPAQANAVKGYRDGPKRRVTTLFGPRYVFFLYLFFYY